MAKQRKLPKTRNPMARALQSPLFHQRSIPSTKAYRRKSRNKTDLRDGQ